VKSAHEAKDGRYYFQLQSRKNRISDKDFVRCLDSFYLVFLDEEGAPVYRLRPTDITARCSVAISDISRAKYPMQLLGYLRN
jgi:hypothetical protein